MKLPTTATLAALALAACGFIDYPDRPLHPNIEDRRTKDGSLWTPLPPLATASHTLDGKPVPYVADLQHLPKAVATRRGWMLRHADRPYYDRFIPSAKDDDAFNVACETRLDPEQAPAPMPFLMQYHRHCD